MCKEYISAKTDIDFKHFYRSVQKELIELKTIENQEKKQRKRKELTLYFFMIIGLFLVLFQLQAELLVYITAILIFLIFFVHKKKKQTDENQRRILASILPRMMANIFPTLYVYPDKSIPYQTFMDSSFFKETDIDSYAGKYMVEGKIGKTFLSFSEIKVQQKGISISGNVKWESLFEGLFFVADFHKHFNGMVTVIPKKKGVQKMRWKKPDIMNRKDIRSIVMDNVTFRKEFDIKTTDANMARYVLTPVFMEKLLSFSNKQTYPPMFTFRDGKMYLGLRQKYSIFHWVKRKTLKEILYHYFCLINQALHIVNELDLNKRIWNKY